MNEERFWAMVEHAWSQVAPEVQTARQKLLSGKVTDADVKHLHQALDPVLIAYEDQIDYLSKQELIDLDRIVERKLYDIDRADVHRHHGGPIERFIFARSFMVLAGKDYYDAVNNNAERVVPKLESEGMSQSARVYYFHKHDEEMPASDISRDTRSNQSGWNGK
ncbi:MAG: hypothetical protein K2X77_11400 [Candidatus Obscuribacterales bacterium]|nr:hypothetical protein [Candidatus Obscuribacterales bacterium]